MSRYNKDIGEKGEDIAAQMVVDMGMTILQRNFCVKGGEIDIIAVKDNEIHFIEVKTRSVSTEATIEASLNDAKLRSLHRTALVYLSKNRFDYDYEVFFDLITVVTDEGEKSTTQYIGSFFYPSW